MYSFLCERKPFLVLILSAHFGFRSYPQEKWIMVREKISLYWIWRMQLYDCSYLALIISLWIKNKKKTLLWKAVTCSGFTLFRKDIPVFQNLEVFLLM